MQAGVCTNSDPLMNHSVGSNGRSNSVNLMNPDSILLDYHESLNSMKETFEKRYNNIINILRGCLEFSDHTRWTAVEVSNALNIGDNESSMVLLMQKRKEYDDLCREIRREKRIVRKQKILQNQSNNPSGQNTSSEQAQNNNSDPNQQSSYQGSAQNQVQLEDLNH